MCAFGRYIDCIDVRFQIVIAFETLSFSVN